jgi:hypothetical protein
MRGRAQEMAAHESPRTTTIRLVNWTLVHELDPNPFSVKYCFAASVDR